MFEPLADLWLPQRRGIEMTLDAIARRVHPCVYSPTGGGKTRLAIEVFRADAAAGRRGSFYVNRTLLIPQTAARFQEAGLAYGIRAAGYEDYYYPEAPFQIISADSERSRVYERKTWKWCPADTVIVDEAHLQRTNVMKQLMTDHKAGGATVIGLTATPIGLSDWYDELLVTGTMQEYRDCQALVLARVFSVQQPDLHKVARNKTGEYILDGKKRAIYTQSIVGSVIDRWKHHNPDARPTMAYWPGKPESVWGTEQFRNIGVRWAHVDATDAVIDGKRATLTRPVWQEIMGRYEDGTIQGLSSRFKLREGLDFPGTFMCLLATPIGSLASYIQTCGRVLRFSQATPHEVIVSDHGGNYLRHGSPNSQLDWQALWTMPEAAVSEGHINGIKDGKITEPIRCPQCGGERPGGFICPHCGFEHEKSKRLVLMEDGALVERDGRLIRERSTKLKPDTAKLWESMFWGWRKSPKTKGKRFTQLAGWFAHKHHYHPPRNLPFMPLIEMGWHRDIGSTPLDDLYKKEA